MSTIDIRSGETTKVNRIRFADDRYASACFITRLEDGDIIMEDKDEDGCSYRLEPEDVDNFILARAKARELGWNI